METDYSAALIKLMSLGYKIITPEQETVYVESGMLMVQGEENTAIYTEPRFFTDPLVIRLSRM